MCLFFLRDSPPWASASSFTRYLHHTQRRATVGRIPLDEWSAHRRDLYLTTNNTHNRQTSMPADRIRTCIPSKRTTTKYTVWSLRYNFCLFLVNSPPPSVGQGLFIHELSRSHTTTHHTQQDSSGRVIIPTQRPLPDNTQHSQQTDIHARRQDSNPQS